MPGIVTSVQSPMSKVELLAIPLSTNSSPGSPVRQAVGQECFPLGIFDFIKALLLENTVIECDTLIT